MHKGVGRNISRGATEKIAKNPKNSTIEPLPGGQRKKDQKLQNNTGK